MSILLQPSSSSSTPSIYTRADGTLMAAVRGGDDGEHIRTPPTRYTEASLLRQELDLNNSKMRRGFCPWLIYSLAHMDPMNNRANCKQRTSVSSRATLPARSTVKEKATSPDRTTLLSPDLSLRSDLSVSGHSQWGDHRTA
jgi:hypothetical protein